MEHPEGMRRARQLQFDAFFLSEGVAVEVKTANLGLRITSGIIDLLIINATMSLGLFGLSQASYLLDDALLHAGQIATVVLSYFLLPFLLEVALDGRTIGKLALGIRVVRSDHGALTSRHCAVRALVRIAELSFFFGFPSVVCMAITRRTQRIGDLAAGTFVIRDRIRLPRPVTPQIPEFLTAWVTQADLAVLPADLSFRTRSFLTRASSMNPESREHQALLLANEASAFVLPPPPAGTPPLAFLQAIMAERYRRDGERLRRLQATSDRILPPLGKA